MSNLKIKKSKILLIILCLLALVFSYSCSCRNNSTGHGNDGNGGGGAGSDGKTPTWSFSPSLDLKNSYNISFKSDGTEKLHATVNFTETDKVEIKKIEIEEVTDPQSVLTKDKMQLEEDGKLTISKETLKNLAEKLTSTDKPATNEVTIKFKLTSTNDTSDNNIQYIEHEFNFIKALNIDENNLKTFLNEYSAITWGTVDDRVDFEKGEYRDGIYTLISDVKGTYGDDKEVLVSECKTKFISKLNGKYYGKPADFNPYFKVVDDDKPVNDTEKTVSFSVSFVFTDIAESKLDSLSVKFEKGENQEWVFKK